MKCEKCGFDEILFTADFGVPFVLYDGYDPEYCPKCGTKLEVKPELPWWCVPGMIVQHKVDKYKIAIITKTDDDDYPNTLKIENNKGEIIKEYSLGDFRPISGPFAMIPEWATKIEFYDCGESLFTDNETKCRNAIWHDCPKVFKGKTFPITDDMR